MPTFDLGTHNAHCHEGYPRMLRRYLIVATLFASIPFASHVVAYRPFASTDADVVDAGELEIEYGHAFVHGSEQEVFAPEVVLNFGLTDSLELVAESILVLRDEQARHGGFGPNRVEFVDTGIFLKMVPLQGSLHGVRPLMPSVGLEAGLLVPTETGKAEVGFEGLGIASGRHNLFLYHLNLGGLVEEGAPGVFWGGIFEVALKRDFSLRLAAEMDGESLRGEKPEHFTLAGMIWELPSGIALDLAGRFGLSQAAPDWEVRGGATVSFSLFPQGQAQAP